MEGMTGTIAWLSHVPGSPQGGLYRPANSDFPFVTQLRLQRAARWRYILYPPLASLGEAKATST